MPMPELFRKARSVRCDQKIVEIPNLINIQKQSYEKFLQAHIDPDKREITDKVNVGTHPSAIGVGFGALWVAVTQGNEVVRVEP